MTAPKMSDVFALPLTLSRSRAIVGMDDWPLRTAKQKHAAIRAVNSHDALVEVLQAIVDCYGVGSTPEKFCEHVGGFIEEGKAALVAAKGE